MFAGLLRFGYTLQKAKKIHLGGGVAKYSCV